MASGEYTLVDAARFLGHKNAFVTANIYAHSPKHIKQRFLLISMIICDIILQDELEFDEGGFLMKRQIAVVLVCVIFLLSITSCAAPEDKVIASLGEYEKKEFFTSGGFQDYTDYAKYYFTSAYATENKYLNKIQETDFAIINTHLDDFEGWIETIKDSEPSSEVVVNYDFDREIIDTEDYFYIDSEEHTGSDGHTSLVRYNIYLFDTQTQVLYYFHNNI